MFLQGFFTFGLSYVCTYSAEQYLVSALVAVLFALMVFWTPDLQPHPVWHRDCLAYLGRRRGRHGRRILLFFHSIAAAWSEISPAAVGRFLFGLVLALTATIASSAGTVVVAKVREQSSNLLLTMAWSMLWGTLLVLAYSA